MSIAITFLIVFLGKDPSTFSIVMIPFAIVVVLALPKLLFMAVFYKGTNKLKSFTSKAFKYLFFLIYKVEIAYLASYIKLLIEQEQGQNEYLNQQDASKSFYVILGVFLVNIAFLGIAIVVYKRIDRRVKTRHEQILIER